MRGVFDCVPAGLPCSARVQVSLAQENIGRTVLPCTSLVDLINYPPDSERLEQKTPTRDAFWCTSLACTPKCIDPVGQIHLEDPGIALIPRVDQYEVVG